MTIPDAASGLGRTSKVTQGAALLALSASLGLAMDFAGIPAALLLGPMLGAIVASAAGATLEVPRLAYWGAQALVGCLIGASFKPSSAAMIGAHWPVFLSVVLATYAASLALGWGMSRGGFLPGTTAVWGSAPGAASVMMLMAEAYGADPRLVAFMQYLRVVFVALAASLVARLVVAHSDASAPRLEIAAVVPALHPAALAATTATAAACAVLGRLLRIPAGPLLVPMVVVGIGRATGLFSLELPSWLLAASYAFVGWKIGLGFTREVLLEALHALLPSVLAVTALIAVCAGLAWILVAGFGIDPLTAYLATSPGGMDTIAIIGATTNVDLPFVMALHAMRFLIVLVVGPSVARLVARWSA